MVQLLSSPALLFKHPQLMLPVSSKSMTAAPAVLTRAMMILHKHTVHKVSCDAMQSTVPADSLLSTMPFYDVMQSTDSHAC